MKDIFKFYNQVKYKVNFENNLFERNGIYSYNNCSIFKD